MEAPWRMSGLAAALAWPLTTTAQASALVDCFRQVGERYGIAPVLLQAIAQTESGLDPRALHVSADGASDIGLMHINTWWLPILKRQGIAAQDLWDPCLNIAVGAWILAGNVRRFGYAWQAVGAYNAGTGVDRRAAQHREDYALRVYRHLPCGGGRLCADTGA